MALRLANQINRRLSANAFRSLSSKRDITDVETTEQKVEDASTTKENPFSSILGKVSTTQYEVCRPRTIPITPYSNNIQNETEVVKNTVALQHLQPSMLPEFYKPPVDLHAACMYNDPFTETEKQNVAKQRRFEESNTCKNVTLPLKPPKLASPFPEPVKVVMHSNTISDQEKAQQMLAEAKLLKPSENLMQRQSSIRVLPPTRNYSTHKPGKVPSQSKKLSACKTKTAPTKCPKKKLQECPPVSKNISCAKKKAIRPTCVRKPPPYPSYSESCHEEPEGKPSECKICPYKFTDHPTFKPQNQKLHTLSSIFYKDKGDCRKPADNPKKPCGYMKEEEKNAKKKDKAKTKPKKKMQEDIAIALKPQALSTFPPQEKKNQEIEKKAEKIVSMFRPLPKTAQPSTVSLGKEMNNWLNGIQPKDIVEPMIIKVEEEEKGKGKCIKFPFINQSFKIVTERKRRRKLDEKCPKKERPKLIKDCPPETDCLKKTATLSSIAYFMKKKKPEEKSVKKKCPKFKIENCTPEVLQEVEHPDPCGRRKKGKTLICPSDLLENKAWKKKKKKETCPILPLNDLYRLSSLSKSERMMRP